jgi:hypothetical protein
MHLHPCTLVFDPRRQVPQSLNCVLLAGRTHRLLKFIQYECQARGTSQGAGVAHRPAQRRLTNREWDHDCERPTVAPGTDPQGQANKWIKNMESSICRCVTVLSRHVTKRYIDPADIALHIAQLLGRRS